MYRKFTNALCAAVVVSVGWIGYEVVFINYLIFWENKLVLLHDSGEVHLFLSHIAIHPSASALFKIFCHQWLSETCLPLLYKWRCPNLEICFCLCRFILNQSTCTMSGGRTLGSFLPFGMFCHFRFCAPYVPFGLPLRIQHGEFL